MEVASRRVGGPAQEGGTLLEKCVSTTNCRLACRRRDNQGMACSPDDLRNIPLFALLDDEETALLANQVELRQFEARQRIYKIGEPGERAYVLVSGKVQVTTVDEDQQEVVVDEPAPGEVFGFASMMARTEHQTTAIATEASVCVEVDANDILTLLTRKPHAGIDMMAVLSRQFHAAQQIIRGRAARSANDIIEEEATFGERLADLVARFGGSWAFILSFFAILVGYTTHNTLLGKGAWDPYPFILLNLFLSMLAAIQAPVIMMSQNRQDTKDRLRSELDFDVNRRAESEIQGLARKLHSLDEKVDDISDLLRELRKPA